MKSGAWVLKKGYIGGAHLYFEFAECTVGSDYCTGKIDGLGIDDTLCQETVIVRANLIPHVTVLSILRLRLEGTSNADSIPPWQASRLNPIEALRNE